MTPLQIAMDALRSVRDNPNVQQDVRVQVAADIDRILAASLRPMSDTAPYAPDNAASKSAAIRVAARLTGIRQEVYLYIDGVGQNGATSSEVSDTLGILPYTAKPRCTELKQAGYIVDSGRTRKNKNGQDETVWVSTHFQGSPE